MIDVSSLVGFVPAFLAGSTLILGAGVAAMALGRAPLRRKRFATTTLLVFFAWLGLALVPMRRPLNEAAPPPEVVVEVENPAEAPAEVPALLPAPRAETVAAPAPVAVPPAPARWSAAEVWTSLLVLGALAVAGYLALAFVVLRRRVAQATAAPAAVQELLASLAPPGARLRVLVAAAPTRPYCFGLRRPTIMLPADLCSPEHRGRLRAVLLHELSHVADGDLRDQLLLAAALPLLYWNPLFWVLRHGLRFAAEVVADDRAAQQVDRRVYVRELIELVGHRRGSVPLAPAIPVLGLESEFYKRMNMLLNRRHPLQSDRSAHTILRRAAAALALTAVTLGFGMPALPGQAVEAPQGKEGAVTTRGDDSFAVRGSYPSPTALEQMLLVAGRCGFDLTDMRLEEKGAGGAREFKATLRHKDKDAEEPRRVLLDLLKLRNELHGIGIEIAHLGPQVGLPVGLDAVREMLALRLQAVRGVTSNPSQWTRTLDELITLMGAAPEGGVERHRGWLKSVAIHGSRDAARGATLTCPGAVAGSDIRKVANLYDDLGAVSFAARLEGLPAPSGVKHLDTARDPQESFRWSWKLQFAAPQRPAPIALASGKTTEEEVARLYRELLQEAGVLPSAEELMQVTREMQKSAGHTGASLERFVPVRSKAGPSPGLQRVAYQYWFTATLWQAMELVSFWENQDRFFRVDDFRLSPGKVVAGEEPRHSCRLTVETFVCADDPELRRRFGEVRVAPRKLAARYRFAGAQGRRDIFVDPRAAVAATPK